MTGAGAQELWPVYDAVFGDQPDYETWRETVWDRHSVRPGFALVKAHARGSLVGFAYGYTGEPGQWWTDNARRVLDPEVGGAWLGGHFELVSIGVLPDHRGSGIGRGLLRELTESLTHDRLLLMTSSDPDGPARRLYASDGWRVIGPGIGENTVIMGKRRSCTEPSPVVDHS